MKNEEKIRMMLHPERYTDEQIDQMLDDTDIAVPDVEEAWQQFKERKLGQRRLHQPMRWAAILITVAALSGISYAAIHHFRQTRQERETTTMENQQKPMVQKETNKEAELGALPIAEKLDSVRQNRHFNNVELQQIMKQLSQDYNVKVVFNNEATRAIRFYLKWEAADSIQDILDRINHFEKVHLTLSNSTITIE